MESKKYNNADVVMYHNRGLVCHGDKGYFGNSFDEIKYAVDNDLVKMVDDVKDDDALCFTTYDEDSRGYAMFLNQKHVHDAIVTEPFTSLKHLYEIVVPTCTRNSVHGNEYDFAMALIGNRVSVRRKGTDVEYVFAIERFLLRTGSAHIGIGSSVFSLKELHDDFEIKLMGHESYRPIGFYKYNDSLYLNDPSDYTDKELESLAYAKVVHYEG